MCPGAYSESAILQSQGRVRADVCPVYLVQVFKATSRVSHNIDLPPDFYHVTAEEIKREQKVRYVCMSIVVVCTGKSEGKGDVGEGDGGGVVLSGADGGGEGDGGGENGLMVELC